MAVELTSPVLGKDVGDTYTGTLEGWLLAEGYAKQDGYTGPGVANTGATAVDPGDDPTRAANREAPYFPATEDRNVTVANDGTNLTKLKFPAPGFDVDADGVDTEAPSDVVLEPTEGVAGDTVTITGNNLEGVTSVTFDGVAGTDLDLGAVEDGVLTVVVPAGTAGPADVVLVDASGNTTLTGGFTYTA